MHTLRPYLLQHLVYPLYEAVSGRRVLAKWRELEASQWLSREALQEQQWRAVQAALQHAYDTVPFYRQRFDAGGVRPGQIQTPADMARIPLLDRSDLSAYFEAVRARTAPPPDLVENHTGGSTGRPTHFFQDRTGLDWQSAAVLRCQRWAGLEPGACTAHLWASPTDLDILTSLSGRLRNLVLNAHILPAFRIGPEALARHAHTLQHLRPRGLVGYTSALVLLARYMEAEGLSRAPGGIGCIIASAEQLYPEARRRLEQVFACPVYDRYGSREVGCIAHECEQHRLHLNAETLYVEAVQDGAPVASGAPGELAITTLCAPGFPLVRYRIEDAGTLSEAPCPCGRGLPVLESLLGRVHDILTTPDGRYLPGEFFPHLMKDFVGVERFQVLQDTRDRLTLRLQPNAQHAPRETAQIEQAIHQAMGPGVTVTVKQVDRLTPLPSGKHRFTISRVPVDFARLQEPAQGPTVEDSR